MLMMDKCYFRNFLLQYIEGCKAELTGKVSTPVRNGKTYLHVDGLSIVLDIEKASMKIANAFNNNRILRKFLNPTSFLVKGI